MCCEKEQGSGQQFRNCWGLNKPKVVTVYYINLSVELIVCAISSDVFVKVKGTFVSFQRDHLSGEMSDEFIKSQ
jgi:hypothetical protein